MGLHLSEWNISILKMTSEIHVFAFIPSVSAFAHHSFITKLSPACFLVFQIT